MRVVHRECEHGSQRLAQGLNDGINNHIGTDAAVSMSTIGEVQGR